MQVHFTFMWAYCLGLRERGSLEAVYPEGREREGKITPGVLVERLSRVPSRGEKKETPGWRGIRRRETGLPDKMLGAIEGGERGRRDVLRRPVESVGEQDWALLWIHICFLCHPTVHEYSGAQTYQGLINSLQLTYDARPRWVLQVIVGTRILTPRYHRI